MAKRFAAPSAPHYSIGPITSMNQIAPPERAGAHGRIQEILGMLRRVRAELGEGSAGERLKVVEKALCQLDAELREFPPPVV